MKGEKESLLRAMSFKTGPASVAGRPVAKPLQLGLQRSDSRLGKGGASFGFGSRLGFGLQGLADLGGASLGFGSRPGFGLQGLVDLGGASLGFGSRPGFGL